MKVYGVYTGDIWEGGGVAQPLYYKKEDALKQAEKFFAEEQEEWKEVWGNEPKERSETYKWFKSDKIEDYWENSVRCIQIMEYDIV